MSMKSIAPPGSHGNCRLLKEYGGGYEPPRQSYPKGYANGGSVRGHVRTYANGGSAPMEAPEGAPAPARLDRPGRKKGKDKKGTNVNVVVMPREPSAPAGPGAGLPVIPPGGPPPAGPMPLPPGPMPPMAGPGPGGPPIVPPMPMRARGGPVKAMRHGGRARREDGGEVSSGSGKSRLDKMKAY